MIVYMAYMVNVKLSLIQVNQKCVYTKCVQVVSRSKERKNGSYLSNFSSFSPCFKTFGEVQKMKLGLQNCGNPPASFKFKLCMKLKTSCSHGFVLRVLSPSAPTMSQHETFYSYLYLYLFRKQELFYRRSVG